jgi:hypothetical protein
MPQGEVAVEPPAGIVRITEDLTPTDLALSRFRAEMTGGRCRHGTGLPLRLLLARRVKRGVLVRLDRVRAVFPVR